MFPWRSVRYKVIPCQAMRSMASAVGWPKLFSPTLMTPISGVTAFKSSSVVAYLLPWWPTTSTSMSGRS